MTAVPGWPAGAFCLDTRGSCCMLRERGSPQGLGSPLDFCFSCPHCPVPHAAFLPLLQPSGLSARALRVVWSSLGLGACVQLSAPCCDPHEPRVSPGQAGSLQIHPAWGRLSGFFGAACVLLGAFRGGSPAPVAVELLTQSLTSRLPGPEAENKQHEGPICSGGTQEGPGSTPCAPQLREGRPCFRRLALGRGSFFLCCCWKGEKQKKKTKPKTTWRRQRGVAGPKLGGCHVPERAGGARLGSRGWWWGSRTPPWWDLVAVPRLGRDRRAPSTCHSQRRAVPEGSGVVQEGPGAIGGLPGLLLPPLGQLLNLAAPSCQDRRKSRNKELSRETLRALLRQCKGSGRKGGIWHRGHALVGNPAPNGLPASGSHPNSS